MVKKTLKEVAAIRKNKENKSKDTSQKVASSGNLPSSYIPKLLAEDELTKAEYKKFMKLREDGKSRKEALNILYFMRDLKE
jgi:hypothetical protein